MYDLQPADLHEIRERFFGDAYFDIAEGQVQFRDILSQQTLRPQEIPSSVQEELAEGFDQLRYMGNRRRLDVSLLLRGHGSAADFEAIVADHRPILDECEYVGIEASWLPRDPDVSPSDPALTPRHIRAVTADVESAPGRHAFQNAQLQWLWGHNKKILPCQPAVTESSELLTAMDMLWGVYERATADRTLDPGIRNATRVIAERIYQTHRQWVIVGQLGRWLHRLDNAGELDSHTSVALMLGSWHEYSAQRLGLLSVPAEVLLPHNDKNTDDFRRYGSFAMDSMFQASADLAFLRTKSPY